MQAPYATRQKWSLTQNGFDGLLALLGSDREVAGHRYLRMRRDLVRLFECRGCSTPDEYADEAINRCARKIDEGEEIRDVSTYSFGVARMLVLEMGRERSRRTQSLDEAQEPCGSLSDNGTDVEDRVVCLRRALARLSRQDRYLILQYYDGDKTERIKSRRELSRLLGIGASSLRMRALRVREKLQLCVQHDSHGQVENDDIEVQESYEAMKSR
jgi:DNA-directed RNA polymerase specialized sigma24 family protein